MRIKTLLYSFVILSTAACVTTPETGRRAFILTSEGQEAQMGEQAFAETLQKEKVSLDHKRSEILERVGRRIAKAANKPEYQWEFKLIESKTQNAFCLPGGKVAVYTGILPMMETEAGMATVLGHEVAHATARHGGQRVSVAMGTQLGLTALDVIMGGENTPKKNMIFAALGIGSTVGVMLPFSRANESEADEIGLIYMARAGYDPREAPKFWDRFGKDGGGPPAFLSTHPPSASRKQALLQELPRVMPLYQASPQYGAGDKL